MDRLVPRSNVHIEMEIDGKLVMEQSGSNLVLNEGRDWLAQRALGTTLPVCDRFQLGDSGNIVQADQDDIQGLLLYTITGGAFSASKVWGTDNVITLFFETTTVLTAVGTSIVREFTVGADPATAFTLARWLPNGFTFPDGATLFIQWTLEIGEP